MGKLQHRCYPICVWAHNAAHFVQNMPFVLSFHFGNCLWRNRLQSVYAYLACITVTTLLSCRRLNSNTQASKLMKQI